MGYFSYDYIQYAEPSLHFQAADAHGFRDVDLMLFDKVIAFDNLLQKIFLIVNIPVDSLEASYNRALLLLDQMETLLWVLEQGSVVH